MRTIANLPLIGLIISAGLAMPAAAQEAAPAQASQRDGSGVEDIVVTATKRNEDLANVPIAASVFTEAAITAAGIQRPADFLQMTSNVTFIEDNAGESYINIRGQTAVRNSDSNVAIVIDGVQLPGTKQFNGNLFDIRQIEVLKGPQSAIYGRNAAAGALVITTKPPSDTFEGSLSALYDNFNTKQVIAAVSGPLTDTLSFRLSGLFLDTDGAYKNVTTGEHVRRRTDYSGRAQLRYTPTDRLTVDLRLAAGKSSGGAIAYNAQFVGLPIGGVPVPALDANQANLPYVSNIRGQNRQNILDVIVKIDYETDFATLTSISNFDRFHQSFGSDLIPYIPDTPATPGTQAYTYRDRNLSQEFRLTSPGDQPFRWQVGFYYLDFVRRQISELGADTNGTINITRGIDGPGSANPTITFEDGRFKTTNFAPFANIQYDVTDKLTLALAGRYDTEKRKVVTLSPDAVNPLTGANYNNCVQYLGVAAADCRDTQTFKQFTPKASLTYKVGRGSLYASYGKGFKSGGFNPLGSRQAIIDAAVAAGLPASSVFVQDRFGKEVSETFEVGAKLRLLDNKLSINGSLFTTKVSNAQQFSFFPTAGIQATEVIDKVKLKGFDIDFTASPTEGLQIFSGYGYTDGEVRGFTPNPAFVGNRAPGSFKYTATLGALNKFQLNDALSLTPRVEYQRFGSIWWDAANTPGTRRKPVDIVNARVMLASDSWEFALWSKNLFDKRYNQEYVPLLGVLAVLYRADPRSYGAELKYRF